MTGLVFGLKEEDDVDVDEEKPNQIYLSSVSESNPISLYISWYQPFWFKLQQSKTSLCRFRSLARAPWSIDFAWWSKVRQSKVRQRYKVLSCL